MLLFNASRHTIQAIDGEQLYSLPYHGIESACPGLLLDLYRAHHYTQIVVINGPGAFTTLRVGCLCINMLHHLYPEIQLYQINKMSIIQYLRQAGCLPNIGYMYIGQSKNIRKMEPQGYQKIGLGVCLESIVQQEDCWYDEGLVESMSSDTLIPSDRLVSIGLDQGSLSATYGSRRIHISLKAYSVSCVSPEYMIDPTGV